MSKTEHKPWLRVTALNDLYEACKEALPWLILLGDKIGNGTPEDPMGRCNTILKIKEAIEKAEGK